MTSEPAYKMQPAGHDAPAHRRTYAEPDGKLKNAFEGFLSFAEKTNYPIDDLTIWDDRARDNLYECAQRLLEGLRVTPEEAHGLLLTRKLNGMEYKYVGYFLSAIYNKSDAKEIVYDLDFKICNLAYRLSQERTFINRSGGYHNSGANAQGIIINYLENRNLQSIFAGSGARGQIITYGADADAFYYDDEDNYHSIMASFDVSVVEKVNFSLDRSNILIQESLHITNPPYSNSTLVIVKEEINKIPELRQYIDDLQGKFEQGRRDYHIVIETIRGLGPQPNKKIRQDLVDILKRAGQDV